MTESQIETKLTDKLVLLKCVHRPAPFKDILDGFLQRDALVLPDLEPAGLAAPMTMPVVPTPAVDQAQP